MFIQEFESKVKKSINGLITNDDKVLVAFSGGKDSMTILYLLKKFGYNVQAIMIDVSMGDLFKQNVENAKVFCKKQGIKLHLISVKEEFGKEMPEIHELIQKNKTLSNCMICGVFKRYLINKKARDLKATKLVTGHNQDDLVESVIMNLIMNNPRLNLNLKPVTGVLSEGFVQRVKPLNYVPEEDIKKYSELMGFKVNYEICPKSSNAFRRYVRNLLKDYEVNKDNIVKFLDYIHPMIKIPKGSLRQCVQCGEPSRNELCKACALTNLI